MDKTFQVPATLDRFSSKADGSAGISFSTNELSDTDFLELKRRQGKFGYLCFKENTFSSADLPKEDADEGQKTPSKRLRSVLFILWQQEGKKGEFEVFYRENMNKAIENIKARLD